MICAGTITLWLVAMFALGVASGCARERTETRSAAQALTEEQCNFFQSDGKVQICHRTSSPTKPYTIIKVSTQGCIDGHAAHDGDYVAVNDPTCNGQGCYPVGAPFDGTVECCDYLWQDASGRCARRRFDRAKCAEGRLLSVSVGRASGG